VNLALKRGNNMKKILLSILIVLIASSGIYVYTESKRIGQVTDSYKNVQVHFNGIAYSKAYGESYSKDGYCYGMKWQCVEYVKRFYYLIKNHKMPNGYGNAKDFYNPYVTQGGLNKDRGMLQYRNEGNMKPKADDLLVFADRKYGHVGIITKVTKTYIEIIQQNVYSKTRARYSLKYKNGNYYVGTTRKPAAWLRCLVHN
jgi:surface antigen